MGGFARGSGLWEGGGGAFLLSSPVGCGTMAVILLDVHSQDYFSYSSSFRGHVGLLVAFSSGLRMVPPRIGRPPLDQQRT
jgi:hypothetical protein